jgi:hypothetical protein
MSRSSEAKWSLLPWFFRVVFIMQEAVVLFACSASICGVVWFGLGSVFGVNKSAVESLFSVVCAPTVFAKKIPNSARNKTIEITEWNPNSNIIL